MIPGLCSLVYRAGSGGIVGSFSAIASPSALYGGDGQTNIGPTVAMPIGGTAPYTYSWVFVTGQFVTANNPTSASTGFSCGTLNPGDNINSVYACTVTDHVGRVVQTNQVQANFSRGT